jgi:lipoate-protein ligase A
LIVSVLLGKLICLLEVKRRGGAANMSVDEAILRTTALPVLRVYGWREPAISFGCLMPLSEVRESVGEAETLVRRWTGGGIVAHGCDWTYSLIVPQSDPFATGSTWKTYEAIHSALAAEFRANGVSVTTAGDQVAGFGGMCFARPVTHDLVWDGRKVGGAAQRRCRQGVLHQGSVQGIAVASDLAVRFAQSLSSQVIMASEPPREAELLAETLSRTKYGTDRWLRRR